MRSTIYLAGPIAGEQYDDAVAWRLGLSRLFAYFGVQALSPMRGKDRAIFGAQPLTRHGYPTHPLTTQKAVVARDRFDVMQQADLVLLNLLGARSISIGSMVELGWADAVRKPVVLALEADGSNVHEHLFLREIAGHQAGTLAEAAAVALSLLNVTNTLELARIEEYLASISQSLQEGVAP